MIPCLNEEKGIGKTIEECRKCAPDAEIIVYDNASTDNTAHIAREHGAEVRYVPLRGKGNVIRQMFTDACGEIICMTDGDGTYSMENFPHARDMIENKGYDMIIGRRVNYFEENTVPLHSFGNRLVNTLVSRKYRTEAKDVMSGFRVFSPRFTRTFIPVHRGFEIETEMTMFVLDHGMKIGYVDTLYSQRKKGDPTKTKAVIDGTKIVWSIITHKKRHGIRF